MKWIERAETRPPNSVQQPAPSPRPSPATSRARSARAAAAARTGRPRRRASGGCCTSAPPRPWGTAAGHDPSDVVPDVPRVPVRFRMGSRSRRSRGGWRSSTASRAAPAPPAATRRTGASGAHRPGCSRTGSSPMTGRHGGWHVPAVGIASTARARPSVGTVTVADLRRKPRHPRSIRSPARHDRRHWRHICGPSRGGDAR